MSSFRASVDRHLEAFLTDLRTFVEVESPTMDKAACDRAGQHLAARFREYAGAEIAWHPQDRWGDHFEARIGSGRRRILLLGHFDTVWALGTLARLPCRIQGDRMTGPGCFDMKYGDMQALWALRLVMESGAARDKTFVFLGNADEEVGSPTSRPIIERLARESESVLVLEPSVGTARSSCGGRGSASTTSTSRGWPAMREPIRKKAAARSSSWPTRSSTCTG